MTKTERAHLITILELAQACHVQLGNFLLSHAQTVQATSGSIKQEHFIEQTEAVLENLMLLHRRLGNSFHPFEHHIALGLFERDQKPSNSFERGGSIAPYEIDDGLTTCEEPECEMFKTVDEVLDYLNGNEDDETATSLLNIKFAEQSEDPKLQQEIIEEIRSRVFFDKPPSTPNENSFHEIEKEQIIGDAVRLIKRLRFMIEKHGLYRDAKTQKWVKPNSTD